MIDAPTWFSAAVGIFMVANYLLAKGWFNPAAAHDKDFILLLLVVLIGAAYLARAKRRKEVKA